MNDIIDESTYKTKKLDKIDKFLIISIGFLVISSTLIYFFGYNLFKSIIQV